MMEKTRMCRRSGAQWLVAILTCVAIAPVTAWGAPPEKPLVLLELFTSEGCSSCPPADRVLTSIHDTQPFPGVTVVPLAFHVDYWDRLGWTDPFGNKTHTLRQHAYADMADSDRVYTPQMIVNGVHAFVGSNKAKAWKAIEDTTTRPAQALEIAVSKNDTGGRLLHFKTEIEPAADMVLWVAVTEDGLSSEVTKGENRGKTLHHDAVVRWFMRYDISDTERTEGGYTANIEVNPTWKQSKCEIVAAIQSERSGAVLALGHTPLGSSE